MLRSTSRISKAAAVSAAALLALTACGDDNDEAADNGESGEVITVGIAGEVPYSYLNDEGEPEGATVALSEKIFGDMGYEVEAELVEEGNPTTSRTSTMSWKPKRMVRISSWPPSPQVSKRATRPIWAWTTTASAALMKASKWSRVDAPMSLH